MNKHEKPKFYESSYGWGTFENGKRWWYVPKQLSTGFFSVEIVIED